MQIWAAVDVDKPLRRLKETVTALEKELCFEQSNCSALPLHISLKLPAEVPDSSMDALREDISALFQAADAFETETDGIELHDGLIWIRIRENERLRSLHSSLCTLYRERYGLPLHRFDTGSAFTFHVTLFLDRDMEKLRQAYQRIRSLPIPRVIPADTFIIGSSPEGQPGTWHVDRSITR